MSRRSNAVTAARTEAAANESAALASWNLSAAEKQAQRDGIRAGYKLRLRTAAASIVQTCEALRAEGITVSQSAYLMTECDPETGEHLDARSVLAEAEERAAAHRRGRWVLPDGSRMQAGDLMRLAAYARRCAERMARPPLSESEAADVEGNALAAILARADLRGALPRWRALAGDDLSAAVEGGGMTREALETLRGRWRGFAFLEAREAIRKRHKRLSAETAADWSEAGEDGATPEQAAAAAAETAGAVLRDAVADLALPVYFLSATAPGESDCRPAERDALALALSACTCKGKTEPMAEDDQRCGYCGGVSRAMLAAARGVDSEAVKKGAQRGRKHLAARVDTRTDVARWTARAERRAVASVARPAGRPLVEAAMHADIAPTVSARQVWPDRVGKVGKDGAYSVPAPPAGAGTRANVARPVIGCAERPALPRRTVSGAPILPAHLATLRHLARTARTLAAIPPREAANVPAGVTYSAPPALSMSAPSGHPAPGKERMRMRTAAAEARQRAARWDAPPID